MAKTGFDKAKDYRELFTREHGDRGAYVTKPEYVGELGLKSQPHNNYVHEGAQIPTEYMVRYDGRLRRVYNMYFGGRSQLWINVRGLPVNLDPETSARLEKLTERDRL